MDDTRDTGQDDRDFFDAMGPMESDEITNVVEDLNLAATQVHTVEGRPVDSECKQQTDDDGFRVWSNKRGKRRLVEINSGDSDNLDVSPQFDIIVIKPVSMNAGEFLTNPR